MDINKIWVFDVSKMNNRRFNAKRDVVRFRIGHITLACDINLFTSPISFPCPFNSVFPTQVSFYTK